MVNLNFDRNNPAPSFDLHHNTTTAQTKAGGLAAQVTRDHAVVITNNGSGTCGITGVTYRITPTCSNVVVTFPSALLPAIRFCLRRPPHQTFTMAPDLNSVPASPRIPSGTQANVGSPHGALAQPASHHSSAAASRRASQIYPMSPPPLPLASPGGTLPTNTQAFPPLSPSVTGNTANVDAMGAPMRHPRPLTAAELHLELEKEQEAVVC
jgi:hypothetical protein